MYLLVAPFSWTFDDIGLTYSVPDLIQTQDICEWTIVEIPLREKKVLAIVLKILKNETISFEKEKLKEIIKKKWDIFIYPYQITLLVWISSHYITPIHNSASLFFPRNLREKIEKEKLKARQELYNYQCKNIKSLSSKQQQAYEKIIQSEKKEFLFWGLTWSWKTEIYIHLTNYFLNLWKQILILVPEIILWNQVGQRFQEVFWDNVIIINSLISEATKTKYWQDIHSWNAKIVVWTRSSLFYPYKNLGLIIQDEEHDFSYDSDSSPRYRGSEVVQKISKLTGIKVIYASGTPSIDKMYKAKKWDDDMELISLLEKYK